VSLCLVFRFCRLRRPHSSTQQQQQKQCTSAVAAAIDAGRCQAGSVHAFAVERPPDELQQAAATGGGGSSAARVTDLFTGACAWLDSSDDDGGGGGGSGTGWAPDGLQKIARAAGLSVAAAEDTSNSSAGRQQQLCVVIDSLSALLQRYAPARVLGLLDALQRSPSVSSILALIHAVRFF
jgi:hypothetical protein